MEYRSQPAGAPYAVLHSPVPSWGHHRIKAGLKFAFLGKKKKTKREKTHNPQRSYKQQQGASDSEERATIRSQSHPRCYQTCYGHNVDHLPHELPSSTGLFSLTSLPFSSLKHLFPDRKKLCFLFLMTAPIRMYHSSAKKDTGILHQNVS